MNFKYKFKGLLSVTNIFLLPFFFVLHGYRSNAPLVSIKDAVILFLEYLIGFLVIYLFVSKYMKSSKKASFLTMFLMCIFFFFGWMHDLEKKVLHNSFLSRYSLIIPVLIISVVLIIRLIKKSKFSFSKPSQYFNVLFSILIIIEIGFLLKNSISKKEPYVHFIVQDKGAPKPDVYFIVSDGYAGQEELRNILNYDNSVFLDQLKSKGFHIVSNSRSNYNLTPFSLASTLKMDYLTLNSFNENPEDLNNCFKNINSNEVIHFFKKTGYELVNYSIFQFDETPPLITSQFFEVGPGLIHSQTILGRIEKDLFFNLITKYKFKWAMKIAVKKEVKKTEQLYQKTLAAANKKCNHPRFVYTHLMMPHYPYYLDSNGHFNDYNSILEANWASKDGYINYLKYCNNKLLKLVDHILQNSEYPPIIILLGDHGFREFSTQPSIRKYYFMNLNAIYLPNKNYSCFKQGLSNVNEFRCLFNTAFNQNYDIKTDSTIFIK